MRSFRSNSKHFKGSKEPNREEAVDAGRCCSWRSIRGLLCQRRWFAHRVAPVEGDGDIVLRSIADGKETKFPAGAGFGSLEFSFDSKWLAFTCQPGPAEAGVPSMGPRPKQKVVLVNVANGEKTEFEGMQSFQFSAAATHLARIRSPGRPAGRLHRPFFRLPSAAGSDSSCVSLLAALNWSLATWPSFHSDKSGNWLVMVIDAVSQIGNGVQLRDMKTEPSSRSIPRRQPIAISPNRDRNASHAVQGFG